MLVYFIFYDDYDLYNAENDHQNIIKLKSTKSTSSVSLLKDNDSELDKDKNDLCSLCLEEITITNEKIPALESSHNKIKDVFVFKDLSKYNYNNLEYTHTCDCCPMLHSECLIKVYEEQKSCLICRQPIYWRFSKIEDVKNKLFHFFLVTFFDRICVFLNVGFCSYMLFVIIYNICNSSTSPFS